MILMVYVLLFAQGSRRPFHTNDSWFRRLRAIDSPLHWWNYIISRINMNGQMNPQTISPVPDHFVIPFFRQQGQVFKMEILIPPARFENYFSWQGKVSFLPGSRELSQKGRPVWYDAQKIPSAPFSDQEAHWQLKAGSPTYSDIINRGGLNTKAPAF